MQLNWYITGAVFVIAIVAYLIYRGIIKVRVFSRREKTTTDTETNNNPTPPEKKEKGKWIKITLYCLLYVFLLALIGMKIPWIWKAWTDNMFFFFISNGLIIAGILLWAIWDKKTIGVWAIRIGVLFALVFSLLGAIWGIGTSYKPDWVKRADSLDSVHRQCLVPVNKAATVVPPVTSTDSVAKSIPSTANTADTAKFFFDSVSFKDDRVAYKYLKPGWSINPTGGTVKIINANGETLYATIAGKFQSFGPQPEGQYTFIALDAGTSGAKIKIRSTN